MIRFECGGEPPPYYSYLVLPKLDVSIICSETKPPNFLNVGVEINLSRYLFWFFPLIKRYSVIDQVNDVETIQLQKEHAEKVKKKTKLKDKLEVFLEHPGTSINERENIRLRLRELSMEMEFVPKPKKKRPDRVKLFIDNLDYMSGGFCALGECGYIYVYGLTQKDVEFWAEVAEYFADRYMRIPENYFPRESRQDEGRNITEVMNRDDRRIIGLLKGGL